MGNVPTIPDLERLTVLNLNKLDLQLEQEAVHQMTILLRQALIRTTLVGTIPTQTRAMSQQAMRKKRPDKPWKP